MESNISDLLWGFDSLMIFCLCYCDFTLSNSNTEICASDQVTLRQIKKALAVAEVVTRWILMTHGWSLQ